MTTLRVTARRRPLHRQFGAAGSARASLYVYNTIEEVLTSSHCRTCLCYAAACASVMLSLVLPLHCRKHAVAKYVRCTAASASVALPHVRSMLSSYAPCCAPHVPQIDSFIEALLATLDMFGELE